MFKGLFEPSACAVREAWLQRLSIRPPSMAGAKENLLHTRCLTIRSVSHNSPLSNEATLSSMTVTVTVRGQCAQAGQGLLHGPDDKLW